MQQFPLRPYQSEALDAIGDAETRGISRPLVVAPTGAGKTVMFSHAITARGGRALVLAHRDELISQAANKIRQVSGRPYDVGIVKAHLDEHAAPIVVASVQTLCRPKRLAKIRRDFRTIVVDEAHHATARTYLDVLGELGALDDTRDLGNGPLTVGFTATAGRADGIGLGHVWQEIVYRRGILQMIVEGYLVDVSGLDVGTDLDLSKVATSRGDYQDAALGAAIERSDAIDHAAVAYAQYAHERKGIAFTPTVATSRALTDALCRYGIAAEHLDGTTDSTTRREILIRLATGQTQVVSNCAVLTEGFDEPSVSAILNLRPTKSQTLFVQMVGRALRCHPGKNDALLLDLGGASSLGLATIADLAGLPPGSVKPAESLLDAAERIEGDTDTNTPARHGKTRTVNLFDRSHLRWLAVDDAHMLELREVTVYLIPNGGADEWDVFLRPRGSGSVERTYERLCLDYAYGVGEELARNAGGSISRRDAGWRSRPPSRAQISMLSGLGYGALVGAIDNAGQASDLIAAHKAADTVRRIKSVVGVAS